MNEPDWVGARAYALERLQQELQPHVVYHSVAHTACEVIQAVEQMVVLEGVAAADAVLLRTAVYFHDLGFIQQRIGHEQAGVQIACEVLPRFGYSTAQIETVCNLIMATRMPQTPHTLFEQIIADADLSVLGGADFAIRNQQLRLEIAAEGTGFSDTAWYEGQVAFLQQHRYWTAAARSLYDAAKQRHLAQFQALLGHSPINL